METFVSLTCVYEHNEIKDGQNVKTEKYFKLITNTKMIKRVSIPTKQSEFEKTLSLETSQPELAEGYCIIEMIDMERFTVKHTMEEMASLLNAPAVGDKLHSH